MLVAIPFSGRLYGRMNGKSTTTGVLARQLNRANTLPPTTPPPPPPFLTVFFLFFPGFYI